VEKITRFPKKVKYRRPLTASEWFQKGLSFENARGHEQDIASCFREATLLDPKFFMAWLKLGIIEQNHYRWENASMKYLEAVKLRPAHSEANFRLAQVFENLGDIVLAIKYSRKAIETSGTYWEARSLLANLLYRLGGRHRFVEALTHLNLVISDGSSHVLRREALILSAEIRQSITTRLLLVSSTIQ